MTKRGKILRDAQTGPGLLMVEGQQYQFPLDGVWKSAMPPKTGMTVDVDFDQGGGIDGLTAVPDAQIAREQAEKVMAAGREKGGALVGEMVARFGVPALVAGAVLLISWFFLSAVSIEAGEKVSYTFWQVLGLLNLSNPMQLMDPSYHPSAGLYGFLAFVSLAGIFLHYVWKDKLAFLGAALPLLFMLIAGLMARNTVHSAFAAPAGMDPGGFGQQMQNEAMSAISVGIGTYISLLASLYFAVIGIKRYLAEKAGAVHEFSNPRNAG